MNGVPLRSMLFVPGDSESKLAKADSCRADAVILDLEDSIAPANKDRARELVSAFLSARPPGQRTPQLWVRINPFETKLTLADLAAVIPAAPDGIMQPKCNTPADVVRLSHYLDALEAAHGLTPGAIAVLPVATETAVAPFHLGAFAQADLPRLMGLTWGAEDLSAALGASTNRDPGGDLSFTYKMVRSLTLLAAHAAGVQAVETIYVDFRDEDGLRASCRQARAEGFTGRMAIHPAQIATMNEAFMPTAEELDHARRVLAAFAANEGVGVVQIDGTMFDEPHRRQAARVLAQATAFFAA